MIIVIQCAARKNPDAGYLRTASRMRVMFVAKPEAAPQSADCIYAAPDGLSDTGEAWRQLLLRYNEQPENNPLGLCQAYKLYKDRTYKRLVKHFLLDNVFILSAGWGLISAGFLTPQYDITFSPSAEDYKRRRTREHFADFRLLPDTTDHVVFLGGKDYLSQFCDLTSAVQAKKTVFYNSRTIPDAPGCHLKRFDTRTRTNWHYECANALMDGALSVSS